LNALDKDGDGKVSRQEWPGRPQRFERLDTNKDGFLTKDELPNNL
jgi:Ca2+-binding EF-hand superfamily protein